MARLGAIFWRIREMASTNAVCALTSAKAGADVEKTKVPPIVGSP